MLSNAMILLQLSACCGPIGPFTRGGQSGGLCRGLWCRGIRSCCPEAHNEWTTVAGTKPSSWEKHQSSKMSCTEKQSKRWQKYNSYVLFCVSQFWRLRLLSLSREVELWNLLFGPPKKKSTRVDPCRWIPSHIAQLARRLTKVDIPIQKYQKVIP